MPTYNVSATNDFTFIQSADQGTSYSALLGEGLLGYTLVSGYDDLWLYTSLPGTQDSRGQSFVLGLFAGDALAAARNLTATGTVEFTVFDVTTKGRTPQDLTASQSIAFSQLSNEGGTGGTATSSMTFTGQARFTFEPIDLTASGSMAFTQTTLQPLLVTGVSSLAFTELAAFQETFFGNSTLTFSQVATGNLYRDVTASTALTFATPVSGGLFRNGAAIGPRCRAEYSYAPFGSAIGPAPILIASNSVTFFYPSLSPCTATDTLILRAPNLGDRDQTSLNRIQRETQGGTLVVFRDPAWPTRRVLRLTFTGIPDSQIFDLTDFLSAALGAEVGLQDWLGRFWYGLIINPDTAITRLGRCRNDISLELEVTSTGFSVTSCNSVAFSNTMAGVAVV